MASGSQDTLDQSWILRPWGMLVCILNYQFLSIVLRNLKDWGDFGFAWIKSTMCISISEISVVSGFQYEIYYFLFCKKNEIHKEYLGTGSVFDFGSYPAARVREFHLRTENVVHCVGLDVQKLLTQDISMYIATFFNILGGFKAVAIIVNKYCHHISYLSSDWPMSSTIDQSDNSFQNVAVLFSGFCNSSSAYIVQAKQSKQLLTKEILLSEATTCTFPHRNGWERHGSEFIISRRALAREGDYEMMPVCACVS